MKNFKNTAKRGIALLLALTMCVGMLSMTAFAADGEENKTPNQYQDKIEAANKVETDADTANSKFPNNYANIEKDANAANAAATAAKEDAGKVAPAVKDAEDKVSGTVTTEQGKVDQAKADAQEKIDGATSDIKDATKDVTEAVAKADSALSDAQAKLDAVNAEGLTPQQKADAAKEAQDAAQAAVDAATEATNAVAAAETKVDAAVKQAEDAQKAYDEAVKAANDAVGAAKADAIAKLEAAKADLAKAQGELETAQKTKAAADTAKAAADKNYDDAVALLKAAQEAYNNIVWPEGVPSREEMSQDVVNEKKGEAAQKETEAAELESTVTSAENAKKDKEAALNGGEKSDGTEVKEEDSLNSQKTALEEKGTDLENLKVKQDEVEKWQETVDGHKQYIKEHFDDEMDKLDGAESKLDAWYKEKPLGWPWNDVTNKDIIDTLAGRADKGGLGGFLAGLSKDIIMAYFAPDDDVLKQLVQLELAKAEYEKDNLRPAEGKLDQAITDRDNALTTDYEKETDAEGKVTIKDKDGNEISSDNIQGKLDDIDKLLNGEDGESGINKQIKDLEWDLENLNKTLGDGETNGLKKNAADARKDADDAKALAQKLEDLLALKNALDAAKTALDYAAAQQSAATEAKAKAEAALKDLTDAEQAVADAEAALKAKLGENLSTEGVDFTSDADFNAELAKLKADLEAAKKAAEDAKKDYEEAKEKADDAREKADDAKEKADEAKKDADDALDEFNRNQGLLDDIFGDNDTEIDENAVPLAAGPVTRAEFVDYLWRHEGSPEATAEAFADVPADHEYAPAIDWARSIGLVTGDENGNFYPDELVTVEAVRSILTRYAAYLGMTMPELTTLTGEAGEAVLNCDQVCAEFFGEEYTVPEDLAA